MKTASDALALLRIGNERFANDLQDREVLARRSPRQNFIQQQRPHTIIVGCSDSRVPAEMVFDQGLGDLFVVRVAGNIIAPSQVGSVEFAAAQFGTRLVVVLGHTHCGAVGATIRSIQEPDGEHSPNIMAIVDRIRPHVIDLVEAAATTDDTTLQNQAMRANVKASVKQLQQGSQVLETLIQDDGLRVVGAEYNIETGRVEFFDGVPIENET